MSYGRAEIEKGLFEEMLARAAKQGLVTLRSQAERDASVEHLLGELEPDEDLWVFGYGSLIWNPGFEYVARRTAMLEGWHRSFCLWVPLGRGTPEQPGLVLGLDRGGHCAGVAYRIAAEHRKRELDLLWRREMGALAYEPIWTSLSSEYGEFRGLTLVSDRGCSLYADGLSLDEVARVLVTAAGELGSSRDYLEQTVAVLGEHGLVDEAMLAVLERVRAMDTEPRE